MIGMEQSKTIIPVATIIPTLDRTWILIRTLKSLFDQDCVTQSVVIVDASEHDETKIAIEALTPPQGVDIIYARAIIKGAAHQRSQAVTLTKLPYVVFMDDDILLEPHCIQRIFAGFSISDKIGGVNAMITNQRYLKPGRFTKAMYVMLGGKQTAWAGKVIGPAWNILPEDDPSLPEYVECDWLNLGCTMYRVDALPHPLFPDSFHGYSSFEDLTLSLRVGKNWTLLNARTARIFHDSQPGNYKNRAIRLAEMEVVNRHYVMTNVLGHKKLKHYGQLFLFDLFKLTALMQSASQVKLLPPTVIGKMKGYFKILFS